MIDTKNDVIREKLIDKQNRKRKKNQGDCLIQENNGYKIVNQYLVVLTLQKKIELKLNEDAKNGNIIVITTKQYTKKGNK